MTTFMKFEAISFFVLRAFGYLSGILGVLGVIGAAGSYEWATITDWQFFTYELHAFGLIGLSFVLYVLRMILVEDLLERDRCIRCKTRRQCRRPSAR